MSIEKYVNSLAATISKERILNDIRTLENIVISSLLPGFESAKEVLKTSALKDDINKANETYFVRTTKISSGVVTGTYDILKTSITVLPDLREIVRASFPETLETEAINYSQVAVLRYIELLSFTTSYAKHMLRVMYSREIGKQQAGKTSTALPKAILNMLAKDFPNYCNALGILAKLKTDVQKKIRGASMITVRASNGSVASYVQGSEKVDPIQANFLFNTSWNPFFRLGQYVAAIQAAKLKESKELLRMFEVQRLYLEQSRKGEVDAALEAEIKEMSSIVDQLSYEIAEKEASYGLR